MKNAIYEYCEERRTKFGLSKAEFCQFLGTSKASYWRLSQGEITPKLLRIISERFLISRERLIKKLCNNK